MSKSCLEKDIFEIIGKDTINLLTRNAVKCLVCSEVLESKHRHHYTQCKCSNETFTDGGLAYHRSGGVNLDLIENLCEYKTYTRAEYEEMLQQRKEQYERSMRERIAKGEVIERGGTYYDVKVLKVLFDNNNTNSDMKKYIGDILENVK